MKLFERTGRTSCRKVFCQDFLLILRLQADLPRLAYVTGRVSPRRRWRITCLSPHCAALVRCY